jgi:hypothetical protein
MHTRDSSQSFDARPKGRGLYAAGTEGGKSSAVEGDSPTHGTVDGPLAPEPLPGGVEGAGDSEMRPPGNDPRRPDGVETFTRMETDAQRHRRQAD